MNNLILKILLFFVCLFACNWLFNHFNAWVGIAGYILTVVMYLNFLTNKKQSKNEKNP